MHPAARAYVARMAKQVRGQVVRAVEFGAHDVNGNAREYFPEAFFFGVDLWPGPNVDQIMDAAMFDGGQEWDLVLSTEMLEHARNGQQVLRAAWKALRPGGFLVATMAAPERDPHGSNGDPLVAPEYYCGVSEERLRSWLDGWEIVNLEHHPADGDLYVTARRPTA